MRLEYRYSTRVEFGQSIGRHDILLRCQPKEEAFQHIVREDLYFSDGFWLKEGHDGFGNRIVHGGTEQMHSTLQYISCGVVEQTTYCIPDDDPHPMFFLPSRLTAATDGMTELVKQTKADFLGRCLDIMHAVHHHITYTPNSTTMLTSAMDVWQSQVGVCQDYAHLMVALCRNSGIGARYVCGLMAGEGQTHAWVEAHDGQCWYAFDPTNDTAIASGYIKLAHGRDALDCPVSRGTYRAFGGSGEKTNISVIVSEII